MAWVIWDRTAQNMLFSSGKTMRFATQADAELHVARKGGFGDASMPNPFPPFAAFSSDTYDVLEVP